MIIKIVKNASLEAEFQNGKGWIPVGGNSPVIGQLYNWGLTET